MKEKGKLLFIFLIAVFVCIYTGVENVPADKINTKETQEEANNSDKVNLNDTQGEANDSDKTNTKEARNDAINPENSTSYDASIVLDNEHCYEGMNNSYHNGYEPAIQNGYASIRVPLFVNGQLKDSKLHASVNTGEIPNTPFRCKNYEKSVIYTVNKLADGNAIDSYLVQFDLELSENRINGIYPVTINVEGQFIQGQAVTTVTEAYTVFVSIEDGKNLDNPEDEGEKQVHPQPQFQVLTPVYDGEIIPGKEIEIKIPLQNMSSQAGITNLAISAETDATQMEIKDISNTKYLGDVPAGGTVEVPLTICVNKNFTENSSAILLQASYSAITGDNVISETYTYEAKVRIPIKQDVNISIDKLSIPESAQIGDKVEAIVHVMNLGRNKVYNVRAELKADGLKAEETLFLGNMDGNTEQSGTMLLSVWGLLESESRYGKTEGKITYHYEDEGGVEFSEEEKFQFFVETPFDAAVQTEVKKDNTEYWWKIVGVLGVILFIGIGSVWVRIRGKRKL